MDFKLRLMSASLLCGGSLAITTGAMAAEPAAGPAIEEVVVTAQRRSESIQNVPMAVSALTEEYISKNNIRTLEDLTATVPSLVTTSSVNYGAAPLSIRGVGGANGGGNNFGDEPVAVYIDDVYIGRLRVATSDLVDVGSIEVLRGPQGALYGRNATAGALIIRSAAPSNNFEAYFKAGYTTLDEYRFAAAVSGPLSDRLTGRLALGHSRKAGWADNRVTGERLPNGDDTTARAALKFDATDDLRLDLIGEYSVSRSSIGLMNMADNSLLADPAAPNTVRPFVKRADFDRDVAEGRFALDVPTTSAMTAGAVTFKAHWSKTWGDLDWVSGWRNWSLSGRQDSDGSALFLFNNNGQFDDREWSHEIRATSNNDHALRWIAGASYIHERNAIDPFISRNQLSLRGAGIATTFLADQEVDAYSLYLDLAYAFNDKLLLRASGRYSQEHKAVQSNVSTRTIRPSAVPPLAAGTVVAGPYVGAANADWSDFSPRVVLEYRPVDHTLVYASYTQGFKSGGFNSYAVTGPDKFEPEEITSFEAGAKSDLLGGRLRLNVTAFSYDYTNLQVRLPVPSGGVNIANAAGAAVKGAELETVWAPVDGLKLTANIAYLDAHFTSGSLPTVPSTYEFGLPVVQPIESLDGNRLSRAPEWQFNLGAQYRWALAGGAALTLGADYRHQSETFFLETNQDSETYRSDPWGQVDARLDYAAAGGRFELSLFARNLTDDRRVTQVTSLGGLPVAAINEPRKWGLQLTVRY